MGCLRRILAATLMAGCWLSASVDLTTLQQINLEEFEPAARGQIGRALEDAQRKSFDAETAGKLGMTFQVYGKYDLARTCYLRAHERDLRSFRWAYYLGNLEGLLGNHGEAVETIRAALKIDADYTPALVRLAQLQLISGDTEQSARSYREAIGRDPELASAHFGLGQVLAAREDWQTAIGSYRRACELSKGYAAAHYALAMAYRRTGDIAAAQAQIELYRQLKLAKQPSFDPMTDEIDALYSGGLPHLTKGTSLLQQGKLREAAAEFEAALKVNPKLVMAHINLIAVYGQLGLADKARDHFRSAVSLDPGWVEAYFNWGMFLLQNGNKRVEAAKMFEKALEVNPNYADAHVQLASLLDEAGRSREAAAHYLRALQVNSDHRQAHFLLAHNLAHDNRFDEAILHLIETIKIEDDRTPVCMRALALAYEGAGNRERALYYIRQARDRAAALGMRDLLSQIEGDLNRLATGSERP